jgi:hypothetical protein
MEKKYRVSDESHLGLMTIRGPETSCRVSVSRETTKKERLNKDEDGMDEAGSEVLHGGGGSRGDGVWRRM